MSESAADLGLIARQQRQMTVDMGTLKDDLAVMMANSMRTDGTMSGLVNEVRALPSQHARLVNRVTTLEQGATT